MPGGFLIVVSCFSVIKQRALNLELFQASCPFKSTQYGSHHKRDKFTSWRGVQKKNYTPNWFLLFAVKDKTLFYQVTLKKYSSIFIWPRTPRDLFGSKGPVPGFSDISCFGSLSLAWHVGYAHSHGSLTEPSFFPSSWTLSTDPPSISLHCWQIPRV